MLYLLLVPFLLIVLVFYYSSRNKGTLTREEKLYSSLKHSEKEEIWQLFEQFFEKEFVDLDDFDRYLASLSQTTVLLFRKREDKSLQGFIILHIQDNILIENSKVTIIQGDFFALSKVYRSHSLPLVSLLFFCLKYKLSNLRKNIYYFFLCYSYKAYLSFGRSMGEYYPSHHAPTPPFIKSLIHVLAMDAAKKPSDWVVFLFNSLHSLN
jgi:hypothetical protein